MVATKKAAKEIANGCDRAAYCLANGASGTLNRLADRVSASTRSTSGGIHNAAKGHIAARPSACEAALCRAATPA